MANYPNLVQIFRQVFHDTEHPPDADSDDFLRVGMGKTWAAYGRPSPIDFMDTPVLDTELGTSIPASADPPLAVVASLASEVSKIMFTEGTGAFIGLYTGAVASEVLACILSGGRGEIDINIQVGTRISLRSMESTAISQGKVCVTFFGF